MTYARGLDLSGTLEGAGGIGGLLARYWHATASPYAINGASFYHADGNGNVTYLANSAGGADAAYRYDPFGRWLAGTGPYATANGMRFSSKPWIAHNGSNTDGLYYYGYRFYDPSLQRWLNRDPINELGFNLLIQKQNPINPDEEKNLYTFVCNAPIQFTDAFGLTEREWPLNGAVCNWCPGDTKVYILVEGKYFTLPTGKCTASNPGGPSTDVDGVWVCSPTAYGSSSCTFYKVNPNWGLPFVTCNDNPPENCPAWNGESTYKTWWGKTVTHPNSPRGRGAPDNQPPKDPPIYRAPR